MTTVQHDACIDQFAALPARFRRGGGRAHEVYWRASKPSLLTEPDAMRFSFGPAGPARIVSFGRKRMTFSYRSVRTGLLQQGEGPWELLLAKHLETLPAIHDYRLHGHRATLTDPEGGKTEYGPDAVWAGVDGTVTCAEVKASDGYFAEPSTAVLLAVTERGLAAAGIRLARITGDSLTMDRRRTFNVCRAFADGLGGIDGDLVARARDALAGGPLSLASLGERLGVHPASRVCAVNALMVRRVAAYDVTDAVTPDLRVTSAPAGESTPDLATLTA